MKTQPFRQLTISILLSFFYLSNGFAQWSYVGPQSISDGWTTNNQITCQSDGTPVIAYTRNGNGYCKIWDGSNWTDLGGSLTNLNVGTIYDLQVDATDRIVLSFEDATSSKPMVIRLAAGVWAEIGTNDLHTGFVSELSIAIDNTNQVWCALITPDGFKLYKESSGSWELQNTTGLPTNFGLIDLAIDISGELLMAFTDVNVLKGNVMRLNNGTWEFLGGQNYTTGFAQNNRIVVASNGTIYHGYDISFIHLNAYNPTTQSWEAAVPVGLGSSLNGIWDLKSGENNNVFLSTTQIASDRARCFRINGASWEQLDANGINTSVAGYPEIASANGQLYATYNDFDLSAASVKKYDGSLALTENQLIFDVYPNPFDEVINFNVQSGSNATVHFKIYSIQGELLYDFTSTDSSVSLPLTLSSGVFIAVIEQGREIYVRRIVKR